MRKLFSKQDKNTLKKLGVSFLDEILSNDNDFIEKKGIIVVPTSLSAGNLALSNARQFLLEGEYSLPPENEDLTVVEPFFKEVLDTSLKFEIRSDVRNFSKYDWRRVVAVFVRGVEWEFEDWPRNETALSILLKVKGFYLKYDDMPINEAVRSLNVSVKNVFG